MDRLQGLYLLEQFVFNKYYTLLDSTPEFRPEIRQLGELMERGVQIVYLIVTLLSYTEPEFINIIRISTNNVHIFRALISRSNITYSVIEYTEDEFEKGDITAVYRLVEQKLEEYTALVKIIIYSNSIVTTQKISSILDYYTYYRDIGNITVKDEIRKAWKSTNRRIIIATNVFGLDINQSDIRVIIHIRPIYQIRNYNQESGRAGRDGKRSETIILISVRR